MKTMKYLGSLVLSALLLFVFAVNFSSVASKFECSGEISSEGASQPATIYMKLEEYRWWVWGGSDGSVLLERPNITVEYFGHVVESGDQFHIFDDQKKIKGYFSTLSKTLAISAPFGFFDGTCKRND